MKTQKRKKATKFTKPKSRSRAKEEQAAKDFAHHLGKAMGAFSEADDPLWKCTQNGLMAFKGLDMTHLPSRLGEAVDTRFGAVNRILSQYDLKSWDDYQKISDADLLKIQNLIESFAREE